MIPIFFHSRSLYRELQNFIIVESRGEKITSGL